MQVVRRSQVLHCLQRCKVWSWHQSDMAVGWCRWSPTAPRRWCCTGGPEQGPRGSGCCPLRSCGLPAPARSPTLLLRPLARWGLPVGGGAANSGVTAGFCPFLTVRSVDHTWEVWLAATRTPWEALQLRCHTLPVTIVPELAVGQQMPVNTLTGTAYLAWHPSPASLRASMTWGCRWMIA